MKVISDEILLTMLALLAAFEISLLFI